MKSIRLKRRIIMNVMTWACLVLFMGLSSPDKLPVVILMIPFLFLFMGLYGLWGIVQEVGMRYFGGPRLTRRLAIVVCLSIVLLMVLQSIGQLALRDIIIVIAIVSIGYIYAGRLTLIKRLNR